MINFNRSVIYFAFTLELVCFVGLFMFGPNGVAKISTMQQQNKQIEQEINEYKIELTQLEKQIDDWYQNSFLKEKIAREELQMARDGDEIYLVSNH